MKNADPKELEALENKFKELQKGAVGLKGDFEKVRDETDQKIKDLRDYLSKYNKLQALH